MVKYTTQILRFAKQGEKTGWTYINIPPDIAKKLKPGNRIGFRVKGKLDAYPIKGISLLPMGGGAFIMPLNAALRKSIRKQHGAMLLVQLEEDKTEYQINKQLIECLHDEPEALATFKKMPVSHQRYFSKWIESAKTEGTIAKRIAMTINAMILKQDFGTMLRSARKE